MSLVFSTGGDNGDLFYMLPTLIQLSGDKAFDLVIFPCDYVRESFTQAKYENLYPLISRQPYIKSFTFEPEPRGLNCDFWRKQKYNRGFNLADNFAKCCKVKTWQRGLPWIQITDPVDCDIIAHRSPRYHSSDFPWKEIFQLYNRRILCIGSPDEFLNLKNNFDAEHYIQTEDFNQTARLIAGSRLFIGNQSSPRSLAEGLGIRCWIEQGRPKNTHFKRSDCYYDKQDFEKVKQIL